MQQRKKKVPVESGAITLEGENIVDDEYEFKHIKLRRARQRKRQEAIEKLANGSAPVCAICGCPHVEILQIGHPNRDGRYHREKIGARDMVRWILKTDLEKVLAIVQLECPYCNFWQGLYKDYPPLEKRPIWQEGEG